MTTRHQSRGRSAEARARSEARELAGYARRRAECVRCDECGAKPYENCIADGGRACRPHGKRVARSQGFAHTPRRGHFVHLNHASEYWEYSEYELHLLAELPSFILDDDEFTRITGRVRVCTGCDTRLAPTASEAAAHGLCTSCMARANRPEPG